MQWSCEEADFSPQTSLSWNNYCREVCIDSIMTNNKKIGGKGKVVEIDESKFGKVKHHRGHFVKGQWVFGGVCRETGESFLVPVPNRSRETLLPIIKQWILPETTIYSDRWMAYRSLYEEGFKHKWVNHKLHFKDPETGVHTNQIEGVWRHAKVKLSQYNRRNKYFLGYLAKFMFISRCRQNNLDPFVEFFKAAGKLYNAIDIPIDL